MNEGSDVRWKQRLQSYDRAMVQFAKFIEKGELNELEEQGLIQAFEYTFELGWNLLRDYLIDRGAVDLFGSRDVIREAFSVGLVADGEVWMEMLQDRNRTSHTYNRATAEAIAEAVRRRYYSRFLDLQLRMRSLADG
ncbi:MAG: nucleotidyltransferase substrate binding protein [Alkalispirochaeta sp.]|jgi:nucleotidyltransferase substrate binding protein (TIGR01987 family)